MKSFYNLPKMIVNDVYFILDNKRNEISLPSKYMFAILWSIDELNNKYIFYVPEGTGVISISEDQIASKEYIILQHVASYEGYRKGATKLLMRK